MRSETLPSAICASSKELIDAANYRSGNKPQRLAPRTQASGRDC